MGRARPRSMIDAAEIARRTGWQVVARDVVDSTNDEAASLRDAGSPARLAVVADRQREGRGRGGRRFESPSGGLYVSLLVSIGREQLPGPLTAATALALAESIEHVGGVAVAVKWPNDLWIGRRKVAGILTEAAFGATASDPRVMVVVGVGVNMTSVPAGLPADVAAATTAVDLHARSPVSREALLCDWLVRFDARLVDAERPDGRARMDAAYRARLALRGERIGFVAGEVAVAGVLVDASVDRGILVRDGAGAERWWPSAVVRDVRPVAT